MNIQYLIDGFNAQMQRERSKTQMTLGQIIEALEGIPADAQVANLRGPHSYRGYYDDLAFKRSEGTRYASDLLADCKAAMGKAFEGYKGGRYVMGELTPVWIADYGCCGVKLIALRAGGDIDVDYDVGGTGQQRLELVEAWIQGMQERGHL